MVCGCACGLDKSVRLFLSLFPLCELSHFSTSMYRQLATPHTTLYRSFKTLHMFSPWPEDVHVVWI